MIATFFWFLADKINLSLNDFVIKAAAVALKVFSFDKNIGLIWSMSTDL